MIFEQALAGWDCMIPVGEAVEAFFDGLELRAEIYPAPFRHSVSFTRRDGRLQR